MYKLCKQRFERNQPSSQWITNLVELLNNYGFDIIPKEEAIIKEAVKIINRNLKLEYISNWIDTVNSSAKCSVLYKHIKPIFEREHYLSHLPYNLRLAISRIRTCNHKLPIEAGRYGLNHAAREDRICTKCDSGLIGDEYHFILICTNPILLELREKYISPYYAMFPSMYKLAGLFNNKGEKLKKLARYVLEGLKLY